MAKKQRTHSHADERWLLTYADMITLLMALFIILYSMSVVNTSQFEQVAESLRNSFSGPLPNSGQAVLNIGSPNLVQQTKSESTASKQITPQINMQVNTPANTDNPFVRPTSSPAQQAQEASEASKAYNAAKARDEENLRRLDEAKRSIDQSVAKAGAQRFVQTEIDAEGLRIRLVTDGVLFPIGSAELNPQYADVLTNIARAINPIQPNPIRVYGHTDAIPFAGDALGNEKLSIDRAWSVFQFMTGHGLDLEQHLNSSVGGFGDRQPLVPNGPGGRGDKNRRVEVLVLRADSATQVLKDAQGPLGVNPAGVETPAPTFSTP